MSAVQSNPIYIDPPSIPAGLTVAEYRRARYVRRRRLVLSRAISGGQLLPRRIDSPAMVTGSEVSYR